LPITIGLHFSLVSAIELRASSPFILMPAVELSRPFFLTTNIARPTRSSVASPHFFFFLSLLNCVSACRFVSTSASSQTASSHLLRRTAFSVPLFLPGRCFFLFFMVYEDLQVLSALTSPLSPPFVDLRFFRCRRRTSPKKCLSQGCFPVLFRPNANFPTFRPSTFSLSNFLPFCVLETIFPHPLFLFFTFAS